MKKSMLIFILLIFTIFTLTARDPKDKAIDKNIIHLQLGLEGGCFKDLCFSPLNYSSNGLAADIGYQRNLDSNSRIFISLDAQLGRLNTPASEFYTSDHYNFSLELRYLRNIPVKFSKIKIGVGGQYHPYLDLVFKGETDAKTFFGLHSLDLAGNIIWDISARHSMHSTISLPVFGLLIRPPWTGWDKFITEPQTSSVLLFFTGKWTSLNDFFAFNWDLQYHFAISRNWDLTAKYLFRYYRTEVLHSAIIPSNQVTIGASFSF